MLELIGAVFLFMYDVVKDGIWPEHEKKMFWQLFSLVFGMRLQREVDGGFNDMFRDTAIGWNWSILFSSAA